MHDFGAGIIVHEMLAKYFVERSPITLDQLSIPSNALQYLNGDGSIRHQRDTDYRFTAWYALYRGLLACFGEERYHRGEALVGLDQDADEVELRFASGRIEHCDLAVCADGVTSTARERLLGITPQYSGYIGWRGIVGAEEVSPETWELFDEAFTYQLLEDGHVVAYPIPTLGEGVRITGRRVNYTWYWNVPEGPELDEIMSDRAGLRRPVSCHAEAVQQRYVDQMRRLAAEQLAPPLAELIIAAKEPFITAIVDAEAPRLVFGRVCLTGDAGIAGRPHAGAGAAKAAANAWALAEAIESSNGDVVEGLKRWEPPMLDLGRALLERTRDLGRRLQFGGPWTPEDPNLRFGLYGPGK